MRLHGRLSLSVRGAGVNRDQRGPSFLRCNEVAEFQNNLMVLEYVRRHPDVVQTSLPGDFRWHHLPILSDHAVWDAAGQKGLIRLLSRDEANSDQALYYILQILTEQNLATWNAVNDARRFELFDPDPTRK